MKKAIFVFMMFLLMLAGIVGCSAKKEVTAQPVDETVDTCLKCKMAVKNSGYAAQYVTADGQSVKFDDLGCMETYLSAHADVKPAGKFIEDAKTKEWVKYESANYVFASSVPTPMKYGVHAFKDKAVAETFAKEKSGQVLTLDKLKTHEWKMAAMDGTGGGMNMNMNMGK